MKPIRTVTGLVAVTLLAAACSSGAATNAPSTSTPTSGVTNAPTAAPTSAGVVNLNFVSGFTGGDRATYEGLIKKFNDEHPNIHINYDLQPWDSIAQKTPAALGTGNGPDLVTPDYNVGTVLDYANSGTILPLDDLFGTGQNQVDPSKIPSTLVDGMKFNGHSYAVPANLSTLLVYYNKDMFAAAGIANPPTTMEELRADAVKLTKRDASGNVTQYGIALPDHQTIANWPILIWADGGDIANAQGCSALGDDATIKAVKTWADLIVKDKITQVGLTGQQADNLFSAKKAAMEINGPWAAGQYKPAGVNFGLAAVPKGSAAQVTLASTVPIVVNKATQHKAEVYTFLSWWLSKDTQVALGVGAGNPPARTDAGDDPALASNDMVKQFAAAAPYARLYLPNVPHFTQIDTDVFTQAIGQITRGQSADSVLKSAAKQMNDIIGGSCGG